MTPETPTPQNYRHSILIIDDEEFIISALRRLLISENCDIDSANNGQDGLLKLQDAQKPYSLIISDQRMPKMTGAQVLTQAKDICPTAIRILMTGYADTDAIIEAVNCGGIHCYITKPWNENELIANIRQYLLKIELAMENERMAGLIKKQNQRLMKLNDTLEVIVKEKTQHLTVQAKQLESSYEKTQKVLDGVVRAMSKVVETRDPYTAGHQERVAWIARMIAGKLALPNHQIEGVSIAASMHDIGKISVPAEILTKPGKLNHMEMEIIKMHCQVAYDILKAVDFPYPIADIILQHHEKIDGSGYPQGLKGDSILPEARIIAVADIIEAMTSHRPYRPALGIDAAMAEIVRFSGILYDAKAVDVCREIYHHEGLAGFTQERTHAT